MSVDYTQWIRKISLVVFTEQNGLDLSEFHIKFNVTNADVETPNACAIRVYNLAQATVQRLVEKGEFSSVVLNAGYEGNFGIIFTGTIKQFRVGRESATDTYVDILASDGDIGYNQGFVNTSVVAGSTTSQTMAEVAKTIASTPPDLSALTMDAQHAPNIRGTVLFGMARARMRNLASHLDASWSIQQGKVVVIPNRGYLEGEIVVLNRSTGLIGLPEQTDGGIKLQCLLNSKLRIGGRVKIDSSSINQLTQLGSNVGAFNQWTGIQRNTPLSKDGTYRAFVVEHEGDTRGHAWYSNLICLAINESAPLTDATPSGAR